MAPKSSSNREKKSSKDSNNDAGKLLAHVLRAMEKLNQSQGCTTREIVTQLKSSVRSSPRRGTTAPRRLVALVRRALRDGIYAGLLKQQAGRYLLTEDSKSNVKEHKTRRGRGRPSKRATRRSRNQKRGGKRRRRRSEESEESDTAEQTDSSSEDTSRDASRKRHGSRNKREKKKKDTKREHSRSPSSSRSRNRSEQKKAKDAKPPENSKSNDPASAQQENDDELLPQTSFGYRRYKRVKRNSRDLQYQQMDEDVACDEQNTADKDASGNPDCGNPDCLCALNENSQTGAPDPEQEPQPECTDRVNDYIN